MRCGEQDQRAERHVMKRLGGNECPIVILLIGDASQRYHARLARVVGVVTA
jgi:hypothetical protein